MLAARHEIDNFIPQRDPFVAIHEIVEATEEFAVTRFEVKADSIFVSDGFLSDAGMIENIAQTAAAQMGWVCKSKGIPVPIGYIANVKNVTIALRPIVGSILQTSVRITIRVMDVIIVEGKIIFNDEIICQCEMRIFVESVIK